MAVAALRSGVPENVNAPGVILRLMLAWIPSTGVPLLAIVLAVAADKIALLHATPEALFNPILMMALAALGIGSVSTLLVAMSIADPLRQLRWALSEVQRGNYNAHMQIYDASELGLLQAGFNDMVRELSERQRLRDLFGRYVGEDVARRALERGTELGGQERDVAVLFVDLVGSTQLAATRPPAEVVQLLNEFFRVVVETVARHGGFVNKFQGDAALAIFGAPIEHPDGLVPRYRQHVSSTTNSSQCWVPRSSASACRPEGPSPATSALKPASSTPSSATRSTRPPGSPNWPNSRMATFWRRRSRSVAPWTPKHCVGMLARWLSSADVLHPPN
ncbi:transmembrane protein [Mycobacterium tuberculosis]|nr:transmembrane protein [Mycobacterium tuberculosis]